VSSRRTGAARDAETASPRNGGKSMATAKQYLGKFGEQSVVQDCACPRCKRSKSLVALPTNFKCADVIWDFGGYLAQVKATTTTDINSVPMQILGAAWGPQKQRMDAGIYTRSRRLFSGRPHAAFQ
jgi:hypothetical protein